MSNDTNFPGGQIDKNFYGSAASVSDRLDAMEDDANVKVVIIAISGITLRHASRLSKSFKDAPEVHRYLSRAADSDFCELVVNAYLPKTVPMPTLLAQARIHRTAKIDLIESGDFVTAKRLREIFNLSIHNSSIRLNHWARERTIFSFSLEGTDYFPIYSLQAGRNPSPDPTIAKILEIFGARKTGLECAIWFAAANDFLGRATPKNTLTTDPIKVITAAYAEMNL